MLGGEGGAITVYTVVLDVVVVGLVFVVIHLVGVLTIAVGCLSYSQVQELISCDIHTITSLCNSHKVYQVFQAT